MGRPSKLTEAPEMNECPENFAEFVRQHPTDDSFMFPEGTIWLDTLKSLTIGMVVKTDSTDRVISHLSIHDDWFSMVSLTGAIKPAKLPIEE